MDRIKHGKRIFDLEHGDFIKESLKRNDIDRLNFHYSKDSIYILNGMYYYFNLF